MQAWQRWTLIAATVTALHGAALWAAGSYRAPVALQRTVDALLTRTVEPPKLAEVELPKPPPLPPLAKVTPPLAAQPKSPPKPAAQVIAQPPVAAQAPPPAAAPLTILTSPSGAMPTAAPAMSAAPPAVDVPTVAKTAPVAPVAPATQPDIAQPPAVRPAVTQLPSTDADHADTQYRIPLPAISARLGEAGRVIVRIQVGLDGKALQVQLKTSSGFARLDDNALATVARWRFKPGTRGGAPDVMWVEQPVNYAAQ